VLFFTFKKEREAKASSPRIRHYISAICMITWDSASS